MVLLWFGVVEVWGFVYGVHGSWFWIGGFGYVVSGMRYGVLEVGDLGGTGFGYEVSVTGFGVSGGSWFWRFGYRGTGS